MSKREQEEFSISNMVPTEEVASGMHQPSGENLWAVPNKADDAPKEKSLIDTIMENPPRIASFDFDDTLSFNIFRVPTEKQLYNVTGRRMSPIIKDILTKLNGAGTTLHMVTSRANLPANHIEVREFLDKNGVLDVFDSLHFVGDDKADKLQEIGSELHFDDDEYEFTYLKQRYPDTKTQFVQIQHTNEPGDLRGLLPDSWKMEKLSKLRSQLSKRGLGLTSIPQSLYGGEVLELPGSPQPSGLSREMGDDEETDYFGASEEGVDFPPEHYKEHKELGEDEDGVDEESFFDFLFTNKKEGSVIHFDGDNEMKELLGALEKGLAKIGETEASEILKKIADGDKETSEEKEARGKLSSDLNTFFRYIRSGAGVDTETRALIKDESIPENTEVSIEDRSAYFNTFQTKVYSRVFDGIKSSGKVHSVETLEADIKTILKQELSSKAGGRYLKLSDSNVALLIGRVVESATNYNSPASEYGESMQEDDQYGESNPEEYNELGESIADSSPAERAGSNARRTDSVSATEGWDKYLASTGEAGKSVMAAWRTYVEANPEAGYDASYASWLKWYYATKGEGAHLSPEQVLSKLQVTAPAETPEPTAEQAEASPELEEDKNGKTDEAPQPTSEPINAAQTMEELFESIANKTSVVSGPFRVKNIRVKRKISRLGGPKAAAQAVLSHRGEGDVEAGLAYYNKLPQEGTPQGETRRMSRTISYEDMSKFENQAIADILSIKVEREGLRRRSMEDRFDGILKFSE